MSIAFAVQGIAKNAVFSSRRTDRAVNADNVAVSLGNANVAAGQIKNAMEAADLLAKGSKSGIFAACKGAKDAIVSMSEGSKVLQGAGKVVEFTADHINPVITVVGGVKVLTADNKEDALTQEALALGGMFFAEGITKEALMMEKKVKDPVTGKKVYVKRTKLYDSNPMLKAQAENIEKAINDYCSTKKLFGKISMKHAPNIGKALLFVGASIGGYAAGQALGEKINENRKNKKAKKIALNSNKVQEAKVVSSRAA